MSEEGALQWLTTADETTLRADTARVLNSLRLLNTSRPLNSPAAEEAARRLVRLCAESGLGAFDDEATTSVLGPLLKFVEKYGLSQVLKSDLSLLGGTRKVRQIRERYPHLNEVLPAGDAQPADSVNHRPTPAETLALIEEFLRTGRLPRGKAELQAIGLAWATARAQVAIAIRFDRDVVLLDAFLAAKTVIPPELGEALFADNEFWSTEDAAELAERLVVPLDSQTFGSAGSLFLNSRLRFCRPRMFLSHPETLVIEPLGERRDLEAALSEDLLTQMAEPIVRVAALLDEELLHKAPRKTTLKEMRKQLTQTLDIIGYVVFDPAGSVVPFDAGLHQALRPTVPGAPVKVLRPGAKPRSGIGRVIKARVTDVSQEGADERP